MQEKNIEISNVNVGDRLSEIQFYEVAEKDSRFALLQPEEGEKIRVATGIIENHMYSASHFDFVKEVTQTQMIARFQSIHEGIFQVCFAKKPKTKEITNTMVEYLENQEGVFLKFLRDEIVNRDYSDGDEMQDAFITFFKEWDKTSKEFKKEAKKEIKKRAEGEERILFGYKYYKDYGKENFDEALLESNIDTGMTKVIDVEVPANKHRIRQIRHDGIKWLIYRNVKYVVK